MNEKKVFHLLTSGETGGIETLCREIGKNSSVENCFCFVQHGGSVYRQMEELGINVVNLGHLGKKLSLRKFWRIYTFSREYGVVVVHHGDPLLKAYFLALKKFYKGKMICFVHSCYGDETQNNYKGIKRKVDHYIAQKVFDISDRVVAVSEAGMKSALDAYRIDKNKQKILYNGISKELLEEGYKNQLKQTKTYKITYIGRLVKEKGIPLLLNAISIIKKEFNINAILIGSGSEDEQLKSLSKCLGVDDIVHFAGQQIDINRFLMDTSIFVYPSTCQEVFGISVVEAMAYGIPCVANRVGGIPEVICDEKDGFLTEESSAEAVAACIRKIILKYENGTIEEISHNAKQKAKQFSILNTCRGFEQIINEL